MHFAGIKTRGDVLKMGIGKYNEECRSIVMRWAAGARAPLHLALFVAVSSGIQHSRVCSLLPQGS